jgi:GTP cyclohydrolase III
MLYVAVDGDDIGRFLTQRIYGAKDDHEVVEFSMLVVDTFAQIQEWVIQNQGEVLFCRGDSILFKVPDLLLDNVLSRLQPEPFTVSVGVGQTLKEAHWALNVAKSLGKARVIHFDEIRKEIFGYPKL